MKNILRKILFGDTEIREYSTVTVNRSVKERVYLKAGNACFDISANHWLVCLEPVVFAIWVTAAENISAINKNKNYRIDFNDSKDKTTVARVELDLFDSIVENGGTLFLLRLTKSRVYHLNFIKTLLLFHRYYKKPHFSFKKLKAFASAYSFPRNVKVISFKEGDYFNIFPMDLLGPVPGTSRHLFGLRHTNVTLARIIETKKIVASEVSFDHKDIIYQLGKHHGGNPPSANSLPFGVLETELFRFPVPAWANSYKEINILKTINLGSHMLLWGEVLNEKLLTPSSGHLFHIHFLHYLHQKKKGLDYPVV